MRRRKSKYQSGGLYATNKKGYVDSVLSANKNLEWVKRLYEQNPQTLQIPGEPFPSTHYMAEGDSTVYPSIVNINGKLQYLGDKAGDYAAKTNTGIKFPNEQQAAWFAENGYKLGTGVLPKKQMGGMDLQSILGYSQGSPYAGNPYLDIHTPEGLIDMSNTPIDLMGIDNKGNKKKMKAGRKNPYRFEGDVVREIPMQTGGRTPIVTNNPNDPRLKAYNDSLANYQQSQNEIRHNEQHWSSLVNRLGLSGPAAVQQIKDYPLTAQQKLNIYKDKLKLAKMELDEQNKAIKSYGAVRDDAKEKAQGFGMFQRLDELTKKYNDTKGEYNNYTQGKGEAPISYKNYDFTVSVNNMKNKERDPYGIASAIDYHDGREYVAVYPKPVQPYQYVRSIANIGNSIGNQQANSKKPVQPVVYQKAAQSNIIPLPNSRTEFGKLANNPNLEEVWVPDSSVGKNGQRSIGFRKKLENLPIPKRNPPGFMPDINQPDIPVPGVPTANMSVPGITNPENPYSKPTKWSYTFPTGEYNGQKTVYFPDQGTWENFIKDKKVNSQQGADYGSALGYFKKGGLTEAQYMTMRGALQTAHHNKMGGRLQMGGNPFKNQLLNFLYDDSSSDMYNAEPEAAPQEQPKPQQQADDSEERRRMNDAEDYNTAMQIAMAYEGNPYTNSGVPIYQSDHPFRAANEDLYTASKSLEGMSYGFGQEGQNGKVDCSGAVCKMLGIPRTTSEEIVANSTNFRQFTGDLSTIKEGTVIGVNSGNRPWEGQRKYGIDHVLLVVKNPKTGKLETKSSSGSKGFHTESLEQSLKTYGKYNLYLGDYK